MATPCAQHPVEPYRLLGHTLGIPLAPRHASTYVTTPAHDANPYCERRSPQPTATDGTKNVDARDTPYAEMNISWHRIRPCVANRIHHAA